MKPNGVLTQCPEPAQGGSGYEEGTEVTDEAAACHGIFGKRQVQSGCRNLRREHPLNTR